MTERDTSARIRGLLTEHGKLTVDAADPGSLADDDDLYRLGLTSHASVTLMLACEDEWDLEFPAHLLKKATFASIGAIRDALVEQGVAP